MLSNRYSGGYSVGDHLFPIRTEKLSPTARMVLHTRGRVGRRQLFYKPLSTDLLREAFFCALVFLRVHPHLKITRRPQVRTRFPQVRTRFLLAMKKINDRLMMINVKKKTRETSLRIILSIIRFTRALTSNIDLKCFAKCEKFSFFI